MRTIIAGSRTVTDYKLLLRAIKSIGWKITVVISGCARGADRLGERYATINGIELRRFPANWNRFGKSAGYRRNESMAQNADALIALWDGQSKGTQHMIETADRLGLKIYVLRTDEQ